MAHCVRHYEEPMEATCRVCHRTFCNRCLVYSFGPNKPPYCVGCALSASGVRSTKLAPVAAEAAPKVDRRAERAERRAAKAEARAMRRAAKRAGDEGSGDERSTAVPAPHDLTIPSSRYGPGEHAVN